MFDEHRIVIVIVCFIADIQENCQNNQIANSKSEKHPLLTCIAVALARMYTKKQLNQFALTIRIVPHVIRMSGSNCGCVGSSGKYTSIKSSYW